MGAVSDKAPRCPECGETVQAYHRLYAAEPYVEPCMHVVGAATVFEDGTCRIARSPFSAGAAHRTQESRAQPEG
jgi:hypothetical protein